MPVDILIADPLPTNRMILKLRYSRLHYSVEHAVDMEAAKKAIKVHRPHVVLIGPDFTPADIAALCESARGDLQTRHARLVAIVRDGDAEARIAALKHGADMLLATNFSEDLKASIVRRAFSAAVASRSLFDRVIETRLSGFAERASQFEHLNSIAIVGDTMRDAQSFKAALIGLLPARYDLHTPQSMFTSLRQQRPPDLIAVVPKRSGSELGAFFASQINAHCVATGTSVLFCHNHGGEDAARSAIELGADGLLPDRCDPEERALTIRAALSRKLERDHFQQFLDRELRLASIDTLTGLHNRRFGMAMLRRMSTEISPNTDQKLAVMAIDIDRFKQVNDTYGHAAGDIVLATVAKRLRAELGTEPLLARFGGEEFVVGVPVTSCDEAKAIAEGLRHAIWRQDVPIAADCSIAVSVSVGIALEHGDRGIGALLEAADSALYLSKSEGRNQVTLAPYAA